MINPLVNRMREGPITVTNPHQDNLDFVQILNQPKYNYKKISGRERRGLCCTRARDREEPRGKTSALICTNKSARPGNIIILAFIWTERRGLFSSKEHKIMTNNYHGHFFGEQVKKELHFTFTDEPNKISTEGISIFVQDAYEDADMQI